MRTMICTTGTSIAQGVPAGLMRNEDLPAFRDAIRRRLDKLRAENHDLTAFLTRASAESNSLRRLAACPQDRVLLLHSETDDGQLCAEELARLLEDALGIRPELRRIEGLQVADLQRFRRVGVQSLFSQLNQTCGPCLDDPEHKIILNATGGFKSVVPYLTLYGLLYRLPVVYIFERSETLLTLPPAPIHFDYERLSRATDALLQLRQAGVMKKEEFFAAIPGLAWHERDWYESLLEEEDRGLVTTSAFAELLLAAVAKEQATVLLSAAARREYDQSRGDTREQLNFILERLRDPLWRQGHRHSFSGTDLAVFKPGNTAQRAACIIRGENVYVCELFGDHQSYERELPGKRRDQYELSKFAPWFLASDQPSPPSTEEEAYRRLRQRCQDLERECDETRALWEAAEERVKSLEGGQ